MKDPSAVEIWMSKISLPPLEGMATGTRIGPDVRELSSELSAWYYPRCDVEPTTFDDNQMETKE
jgi:hypothetical protein